jgi:hypothetical protein
MWAKSPNIFTPKKLMPATTPTCLDFEKVAMPMVHPEHLHTKEADASHNAIMPGF